MFIDYPSKSSRIQFYSSAHRTFSGIDHILGYKSGASKFKKSEIVSNTFSEHNAVRVEINYTDKKKKQNCNIHTQRLNNMLLLINTQWVMK